MGAFLARAERSSCVMVSRLLAADLAALLADLAHDLGKLCFRFLVPLWF